MAPSGQENIHLQKKQNSNPVKGSTTTINSFLRDHWEGDMVQHLTGKT